ncbi:hypothetical protein [Arsenicicoccus dermatophilus]|uniref:hypothetical protein n=1 Tax=Arsenicicoccus dermatophilus TaxID=1076331 RepID=UPI003917410F
MIVRRAQEPTPTGAVQRRRAALVDPCADEITTRRPGTRPVAAMPHLRGEIP